MEKGDVHICNKRIIFATTCKKQEDMSGITLLERIAIAAKVTKI